MKARKQKRAEHHLGPHCKKCGSTEIEFIYSEPLNDHEINERGTLSMATSYLDELIEQEFFGNSGDPTRAAQVASTFAELAYMMSLRPRPAQPRRKAVRS